MKPTPKGWQRVTSAVFYDDAAAAIDWLCKAFGFEVRLRIEGENGVIEHSELSYGPDGLIMVGQAARKREDRPDICRSPLSLGGMNTQSLMIYVDDVDALSERARKAGGKVTIEPVTSDYGEDYWSDRSCQVVDPEGHAWWIVQRMAR